QLQKQGFAYFSLSDELRQEATKKGIGHSREELISFGKQIREEHGLGYLASKINDKITDLKKKHIDKFVVDSIRSTGEVEELAKNKDFILVAIEAYPELRFERMKKRGRTGDAESFEQFLEHEKRENSKSGPGQQLDACIDEADLIIENNGTLKQLQHKADELIK
ncbi:MAG TPA: AAA family ATPase, partial [Blastocatellia bacterium]|nr:AAA family ATPase [Blastocatellia bacterium]